MTWNAIVDAATAHRAGQFDTSRNTIPDLAANATIVTVRNDSGAARDRFDVLGIDAPVFPPDDSLEAFQRGVVIAGVKPTPARQETPPSSIITTPAGRSTTVVTAARIRLKTQM